jgi:MOSC domain-containing protein YiiM
VGHDWEFAEKAMTGGVLRGIAIRMGPGLPMNEMTEALVETGRGLSGDAGHRGKRGLTLLSEPAWNEVRRELQQNLPWTLRRANLLVDGLNLASLVGRSLRIGDVCLLIHGETKPCAVMDRQWLGLRPALTPPFRGGVHAEVLSGGRIRVGDFVMPSSTPPEEG